MGCFDSTTTTQPSSQAAGELGAAWNQVQSAASTPYTPYTGQLTAGLNQGQQTAISQLQGAYGAATPYYNTAAAQASQGSASLANVNNYAAAATQSLGNVQGYLDAASSYAKPVDFNQQTLSQYMNPYTQDVINTSLATANQNEAVQNSSLLSNSIGNGAYGGDRNGIAVATLAGQNTMANNSLIANLNNQNYTQAVGQFNQEQADRYQTAGIYAGLGTQEGNIANSYANLGNQQVQLGTAQGNLAGIEGYLGSSAQQSAISGASAGLQASTLAQQTQQARLNSQYQQFQNEVSYPYQSAGFLANAANGQAANLGGSTTQQGSPLGAAVGLGVLGAGLASGASSAAPSLFGGSTFSFSDERMKENISPIGKTFDGQTMYRFNYKGEPKEKVQTGLMAQEVAQRKPEAVAANSQGLLGVDYGKALENASRGHMARGGGLGMPMAHMPKLGGAGIGGINIMAPAGGHGLVPKAVKHLRPHFDQGGLISFDPTQAGIPGGGQGLGGNFNPTAANPMFNTIATKGGGSGVGGTPRASAPQQSSGLGALSASPTSLGSVGAPPQSNVDTSSDDSGGGLSKNARFGLMAAGLGILGASGGGNSGVGAIGKGGLEGLQTYLGLQQQDVKNAQAQNESAYRSGTLALDNRREDFAEKQAQLALQSSQDIGKFLAGQSASQIGVSTPSAGSSSPSASSVSPSAPSGPSGASVASAPSSASAPAAAAPSAPIAAAATGPSVDPTAASPASPAGPQLAPYSDPSQLEAQAQRYQQAANLALQRGNSSIANQLMAQGNSMRERATSILSSGKGLDTNGNVMALPGSTQTMQQQETAKSSATEAGKDAYGFQTAYDQNGNETKLDNQTYRSLIQSGGTATIGGKVVTATQNPMLAGQKEGYQEWNKNAIAYQKDAPEAQQRVQDLAKIYATDSSSGPLASRFAQLSSFARQAGVGDVLQNANVGNSEAGYDAAKKLVADAAMHKVGADGVGRAPGVALKMAALTQADPSMAPAARFSVLARTQAGLQYDSDMNAYVHDSGSTDIYQKQREFAKTHSMDDYVSKAAMTLPAPAGATPENMQAAGMPAYAAYAKPTTAQQVSSLKPGTKFVIPDGSGRIGTVPGGSGGSSGAW